MKQKIENEQINIFSENFNKIKDKKLQKYFKQSNFGSCFK